LSATLKCNQSNSGTKNWFKMH